MIFVQIETEQGVRGEWVLPQLAYAAMNAAENFYAGRGEWCRATPIKVVDARKQR